MLSFRAQLWTARLKGKPKPNTNPASNSNLKSLHLHLHQLRLQGVGNLHDATHSGRLGIWYSVSTLVFISLHSRKVKACESNIVGRHCAELFGLDLGSGVEGGCSCGRRPACKEGGELGGRLATLTPAPRVFSSCAFPVCREKRQARGSPVVQRFNQGDQALSLFDNSTVTRTGCEEARRYPTGSVIVPPDRWTLARTSKERTAMGRIYEMSMR